MATVIHGTIPEGIRDRGGVFVEKPDVTPQARLLALRSKVVVLKQQHAAAQSTLRLAVEDDGGTYDFQALKGKVHRLASELETAEAETEQWESVCEQIAKAERQKRFDAALIEARKARQEFAEHFKQACLQLGSWYRLGSEIRELVNNLPDQLPNGSRYYGPELKNALAEVAEDPNPLNHLLDSGFVELQTSQSWRRRCPVAPLIAKEK